MFIQLIIIDFSIYLIVLLAGRPRILAAQTIVVYLTLIFTFVCCEVGLGVIRKGKLVVLVIWILN